MRSTWVCILFLGLLVSCQTTKTPEVSREIDESALAKMTMKVILEDISPTFWRDPNEVGSMYFSFFLYNNGQLIDQTNLKTIHVFNEFGTNWTLDPVTSATTVGDWFRCSDDTLSLDKSVLVLKRYTFDFELKDGKKYRKKVDLSSLFSVGSVYQYVYSNEYNGRKNSQYVNSISRPQVKSATRSGDDLVVEFTVNDSRVTNFDVFLYDKNRKSIGDCPVFVNDLSGQVSKQLNSGTAFYVDGRVNRVIIPGRTVAFETGKTFGDLEHILINVTDAATMIHTGDYLQLITKSDRFHLQ